MRKGLASCVCRCQLIFLVFCYLMLQCFLGPVYLGSSYQLCYTSFEGWMNYTNVKPILKCKLVNTHLRICILQSNMVTNMERGSIINDLIHSSGQMLCCLPCWAMTSILQLRKSASRAKAWKMPWAVHRAWLFIDWCMNYIVWIWRRCNCVVRCGCP